MHTIDVHITYVVKEPLDKEDENFNVEEMFLVQTHYVMLFASKM